MQTWLVLSTRSQPIVFAIAAPPCGPPILAARFESGLLIPSTLAGAPNPDSRFEVELAA
jgi:hypothetical protein